MTGVASPGPAGPERLAPGARPLMEAMAAVFPDVGVTVTDAAEARRILARMMPPPTGNPAVGQVEDRTVPGPEGAPQLPVRIYRPPGGSVAAVPTAVFFHGGGWVLGGLDSHDATARSLCLASGAVVVSVDYRLAPEARFPEPAEDAYAAVSWASEHVGELGGDPRALVVAGDSAGGNLATVCTLMARERGGPRIAHQSLIYPSTDTEARTPSRAANARGYFLTEEAMRWFGTQYFGPDADLSHPHAAPLRADLRGLPPAHVVTAGCDPLCDEGRLYAARLSEAGVPVTEAHFPGMFHGFLGAGRLLPDAQEAMAGLGKVIAATASDRKIDGDEGGSEG
ncbi:putative lipase LipH (carboxylesterase) [Streptomyces daqingensis]|uniref:Lipase LipH (Carboxylesterase) n=1 Tax=Streptomyces daqingensis TaxID=1472640 RepID=A0ABQ2LQ96_9ACTN|nr:alpha/beta hydrolase [Streptomyces daqingensis]GGO41801.1 putative lipase LipH (carboxylesterase) [Streptomyces daqingensis]